MQGQLATADTYLDEHVANNDNGAEAVVYIGRNATLGTRLDGLFRFPQPILAPGDSCLLVLAPFYRAGPTFVHAHLLGQDYEWEEETATWATVGQQHPAQVEPVPFVFPANPTGNIVVDITTLAAANAGNPNLNIRISAAAEDPVSATVYSKDVADRPQSRPRIIVLSEA